MINIFEVTETNKMVEKENLDVRTITMGINLLDCASENLDEVNEKIYKKNYNSCERPCFYRREHCKRIWCSYCK